MMANERRANDVTSNPVNQPYRRITVLMGAVILLLAAIALVLPSGTAYADRAYCVQCGRVTTGTIYYDAYDGYYPPTCTRAGTGLFYCDECFMYNAARIPALGHSYAVSIAKVHTDYKAGEVAKDIGDVVGSIFG